MRAKFERRAEMMTSTKTAEELVRMRRAGHIVASVLAELRTLVRPGITTGELDAAAEALIRQMDGLPSFKGYHGYPAAICASVNEEIVHGIPGKRQLRSGDIISLDVGAIWQGYQGDAAITVGVGAVTPDAQRLMDVTSAALEAGIGAAKAGARMGDVSHAIEMVGRAGGCEVVREYGGHGIGKVMHEPLRIPNWGPAGRGVSLRPGMTFALEPMLTLGGYETRQLQDGWTVVTDDGSLAAHFEHTIVVTEGEAEILTRIQPMLSSTQL
jgi:methionyl aminopeptidase